MKIPILKLGNILITSIQVELTDQDAMEFQLDVLGETKKQAAKGIVIDITALDVVDSYLARILNETADMVAMMGAKVVLCGMQPAVALTLIEMGRELIGVKSALNLEQGVEKINAMIGEE
jgi:rsbT antagonist protein RsbS